MPVTYTERLLLFIATGKQRMTAKDICILNRSTTCRDVETSCNYDLCPIDSHREAAKLLQKGYVDTEEAMKERREKNDRRNYIEENKKSPGNNRRRFPDRRLNNIAAEWIPMAHAYAHPITRRVFQFTKRVFKTP